MKCAEHPDGVAIVECNGCSAPVDMTPGMDSYVEVRRYSTTDIKREIYCSDSCAAEGGL